MSGVLITGASSGLGEALAYEWAKTGVDLVLIARREARLRDVSERCLSLGAKTAHVLVADLSLADQAETLWQRVLSCVPDLNVLILNAGVSVHKTVDELTWTHFKEIFATNVNGSISLIMAALPHLIQRQHGHIVGISSVAAFRGAPRASVYCASKAALSTFLEGIRSELKPHHVTVTTVFPGFIKTELTAKNNFPMPFLMKTERAAKIIFQGVARKKAHIAFPFLWANFLRMMQFLPAPLYDAMLNRLSARYVK